MELADNNISNISLSAIMLAASIDLWVWGLFFRSRLFSFYKSQPKTVAAEPTCMTAPRKRSGDSKHQAQLFRAVNAVFPSVSTWFMEALAAFVLYLVYAHLYQFMGEGDLEKCTNGMDWKTGLLFAVCERGSGRERTSEKVHLHYELWIVRCVLLRLSKSACNLQKAL